jgi:hypothetical protein
MTLPVQIARLRRLKTRFSPTFPALICPDADTTIPEWGRKELLKSSPFASAAPRNELSEPCSRSYLCRGGAFRERMS